MVSEESDPFFHEADLDFENVYFEEDTSTIFCENIPTKEKENLHQETPTFCYSDIINTDESVEEELPDEAAFQGEVVVSTGKSQEECYTSSWEDSAQEGEDEENEGEEMKSGKQLLLAYVGDKYHCSSKGDRARPSVETRPLPPAGDENSPVRNEEQRETESDEISYFQSVPEHGSKTKRTEDDRQEIDKVKPDSESEARKREEEEEEEEEEQNEDDYEEEHRDEGEEEDNVLTLCFEQEVKNPHWDAPAGHTLDFLELRVQYSQDRMADDEEPAQKMEDFSGEDHQEAGESFAEYPSDFSSCEYIDQGEGDEESNSWRTGDPGTVRKLTYSESLFVGNREREQWKAELVEPMSGDITAMRCETSDSYSSGDQEPEVTSEDLENQLDEHHSGSRDDLLVDNEGFPDVTLCPAEGVGMSSGSLDDSFFSSAECQNPQISDLGEDEDYEYEEKSNWEQEQERIRAFNEFYEDIDQLTGQEGTGKSDGEDHFPQSLFCVGYSFCFISQEDRQRFSSAQSCFPRSFSMK